MNTIFDIHHSNITDYQLLSVGNGDRNKLTVSSFNY